MELYQKLFTYFAAWFAYDISPLEWWRMIHNKEDSNFLLTYSKEQG